MKNPLKNSTTSDQIPPEPYLHTFLAARLELPLGLAARLQPNRPEVDLLTSATVRPASVCA